ncbi:hypothetical protein Tco_0929510 [Tanacetum coccineum]
MWEKLAKASGLRASADQIRETNPYSYLGYLKEAAGMFESLGKFESTALCYYDLGEYERAGNGYPRKGQKSKPKQQNRARERKDREMSKRQSQSQRKSQSQSQP